MITTAQLATIGKMVTAIKLPKAAKTWTTTDEIKVGDVIIDGGRACIVTGITQSTAKVPGSSAIFFDFTMLVAGWNADGSDAKQVTRLMSTPDVALIDTDIALVEAK